MTAPDGGDSAADEPTGTDREAETIGDLATIVRSKNAGPFRLTLDAFFPSEEAYRRVVSTDAISSARIATAYGIDESAVIGIYELDRIEAVKVSIERPVPAGSVADSDVYGAQQHRPLVTLELPDGRS